MSTQHDILVVGGGHNSLVAAAYLARCGMSVLVLEQNEHPGGGAVSRHITLPGFLHDTHATGAILMQGSPLILQDELGLLSTHGLEFIAPKANEITVFADGDSLVWHRDLDQTCAEIEKFSSKDAEAYRKTVTFIQGVMPLIGMSMARPPVSFGSFVSLLERSPFGNELVIAMMKSSYDVIVERFEHPKVQIALLKRSMTSACGPEERGTGLNILFMMAAVHAHPLAAIAGGAQHLTTATISALEAYGGEVRTGTAVKRIINSGGVAKSVELADGSVLTARKAVLASIHPHHLGDMVENLDEGMLERARRTNPSQLATLMVHAALEKKVEWAVGAVADDCMIVNLVDATTLETFRDMCDDIRRGRLPRLLASGVVCQTNLDPTRAPVGNHVMASYNFVPYTLAQGGPGKWDEVRDEFGQWVLDRIAHYAPGLSGANILGKAVESPLDMECWSPSFRAGDVMGIGGYLHQTMGMRPTPDLSQYRVPGAQGLYLTGPFMHPGGGLTGGGRAVAIRMMEDLSVDYSQVIRS